MKSNFARKISPFVQAELEDAGLARVSGDIFLEFAHLERAHVLGQQSTVWHVKVHVLMLAWGIRN
jgi:hypothetical protein